MSHYHWKTSRPKIDGSPHLNVEPTMELDGKNTKDVHWPVQSVSRMVCVGGERRLEERNATTTRATTVMAVKA